MAIAGQKITLEATFKNSGGTVVDPAVVRVHHRTPVGVSTTYVFGTDAELTKISTGIYRYSILTNDDSLEGIHIYRWDDNGENAIDDNTVVVLPSIFI